MKAIIKYNSGHLAILCYGCSKILKVGYEFNQQELDYSKGRADLGPQYCEQCSLKVANSADLGN